MTARARRAVDLLELAYSSAPSTGEWLRRIGEGFTPWTSESVLVSVMRRAAPRYALLECVGTAAVAPQQIAEHRALVATTPAEVLTAMADSYGEMVRLYSAQRSSIGGPQQARIDRMTSGSDLVGMFASPTPSLALTIASEWRAPSMPASVHRRLTLLALHVENAARLRFAPSEAIAIVEPSGRIAYVAPSHSDRVTRQKLTHGVVDIEALRARSMRTPSDDDLELWRGLVAGEFSLVDHFDSDQRRGYQVHENLPHQRATRGLTAREASVLGLSARGLAGKWIAYSLGVSVATVSETLGAAAAKVGVGSRTALVAMAGALLDAERADDVHLTTAEHAVLADVTAGMTNAQIAKRRGTKARTVANQVAAMLRKMGVGSRRALAARASAIAPLASS